MPSKYYRLMYCMAEEKFASSQSSAERKAHYTIAALGELYASLHFSYLWYIWTYTNFTLPWFNVRKVDIFANYFALHRDSYDSFFVIGCLLFSWFELACETAFATFPSQNLEWRWWRQLIVTNQDAYYASKLTDTRKLAKIIRQEEAKMAKYLDDHWSSQLVPERVRQKMAHHGARASVWFHLEDIDKDAFFGQQLSVTPNISQQVRTRLLFTVFTLDGLYCGMQIGYVILFISVFVYNALLYDPSPHPWYAFLWWYYVVWHIFIHLERMLRSSYFFLGCTIIAAVIGPGHVKEGVREVEKVLEPLKHRSRALSLRNAPLLRGQLAEHNLICALVTKGSQTLFANVLLAFLLTHLPANVLIMARLLLTSPPPMTKFTFWVIAIIQSAAAGVVFLPLAWCSKVYHSPKRFIPKLQGALQERPWLATKLKYDDLYGRLMRGPKMGVYIGGMTPITYSTAFEYFSLYVAYLLMAFGQILDRAN